MESSKGKDHRESQAQGSEKRTSKKKKKEKVLKSEDGPIHYFLYVEDDVEMSKEVELAKQYTVGRARKMVFSVGTLE